MTLSRLEFMGFVNNFPLVVFNTSPTDSLFLFPASHALLQIWEERKAFSGN